MLLADKDKILDACEREKALLKRIPVMEGELERLRNKANEMERRLDETSRKIDEQRRIIDQCGKDAEIARLEAETKSCREKAKDLEKRDPECTSEVCSFIVSALRAEKELPRLEKELESRRKLVSEEKERASSLINLLAKQLEELKREYGERQARYENLKREKLDKDKELKIVRALSSKRAKVEVAMSRLADMEKRKQEITAEGIRLKEEGEERFSKIRGELQVLSGEIEKLKKTMESGLEKEKEDAERKKREAEAVVETTEKQIGQIRQKIATLKQAIADKEKAESDLLRKKAETQKLVTEKSEWIYLRNACSKDGLRALEIDGTAPMISSFANQLLNMSFATNFMVRFRTQDDEGREVLDIIVVSEDGEEVMLKNLSGGERVWVLKALRLAMTLISKEKSGREFKSLLADEEDGPLSVDNAKSFVELYRATMKLGGMEDCYYVSHKPEAVAMADYRLVFTRGGISIQ